jgi:hypothetical protein
MFILSTATVKFKSGHRVSTPPKSMFQGLGNLLQGYDWEHHEIAEAQSKSEQRLICTTPTFDTSLWLRPKVLLKTSFVQTALMVTQELASR